MEKYIKQERSVKMDYKNCTLCARRCGVNREDEEIGYCNSSANVRVARAALHFWEEPIISGERGSGTIFFSGCSLGCIYCQNREISGGASGISISEERLSEIMLELQVKNAHNINLVTPTHYAPSVKRAVAMARGAGLKIPIIYNTGSYETRETVRALSDTVDVWLPDLKYYRKETARKYSSAENLPEVARCAIDEMVRASGDIELDGDGVIKCGVIVRILLLPSHLAEAKLNVKYLYETYGDKIYISLMSQYTPSGNLPPPLNRAVTRAEYRELVDYAISLGVKRAFVQEGSSASESFIPPFDNTGVLPEV